MPAAARVPAGANHRTRTPESHHIRCRTCHAGCHPTTRPPVPAVPLSAGGCPPRSARPQCPLDPSRWLPPAHPCSDTSSPCRTCCASPIPRLVALGTPAALAVVRPRSLGPPATARTIAHLCPPLASTYMCARLRGAVTGPGPGVRAAAAGHSWSWRGGDVQQQRVIHGRHGGQKQYRKGGEGKGWVGGWVPWSR
ncbi:hypothetical protein ZWY2020_039888 [Hordeum vulgare]|nr:hypothetical protein ZWY2020_039888 [Hordeum vulgare]